MRIKKLTSTILLQTRSSSSSKRFSRNDRRFSIRDLDLGRRLSVRSFCRCFYERILRAVSFSGDPFPSQSRVWSGPMERAVFSALLYFYTRARFHYIRWIFDLFVENIKNTGNCPNQRKKRIAIDSNVQHVLESNDEFSSNLGSIRRIHRVLPNIRVRFSLGREPCPYTQMFRSASIMTRTFVIRYLASHTSFLRSLFSLPFSSL